MKEQKEERSPKKEQFEKLMNEQRNASVKDRKNG